MQVARITPENRGIKQDILYHAVGRPVRRPVYSSVLKIVTTYAPPSHTFLKRPFLTDFKKHTPPPYETKF